MSKLIAVNGCTIGHSVGSPVSGGTFTITSVASTKVKAEGKGVYKTTIAFTFTGGTFVGGSSGTALGSGSITATATKVKAEGGFVVIEGDTGTLTGTYVPIPTPPPTVSFTSNVEITDAGQTKAKAK